MTSTYAVDLTPAQWALVLNALQDAVTTRRVIASTASPDDRLYWRGRAEDYQDARETITEALRRLTVPV